MIGIGFDGDDAVATIASTSMAFAANPAPIKCQICGADAPLCGVVDFHKSCLEGQDKRIPILGIPVYYRHCANCGFLFCDSFLNWGKEDFERHIYNEDYILVDPDYIHDRPDHNAHYIHGLFSNNGRDLYFIDYGSGNGKYVDVLRKLGYRVDGVDPFSGQKRLSTERGDVVTAFEVIEHSNRQHEFMESLVSTVKEDGLILFSTLLLPRNFNPFSRDGLNWWYIAPRNGHVAIHSHKSLGLLFAAYGLMVASLAEGLHMAYRTAPPAFARHLLRG